VKLTKDDPDAGGEHHFIPLRRPNQLQLLGVSNA
jgi:hypothetical protein